MRSLSALLLTAAALPALAQAPKWSTYVTKGDGFSILMPTTPKMVNQAAEGVTTHIYLAMAPTIVCAASKSNLPSGFGKANVDAMTGAMRSSMMASSGGTPTGSRKATYAGIAGEQTEFKTSSGRAGATWIAHTPKAVYSLTIVKQGGASAAEEARFFGSFRTR